MIGIDQGHKAFLTLFASYSRLNLADANEAETRLKVIDEILFSVLGWTKEDVSVEERVSEDGLTKYADYIVRTVTTSVLIEAKRVGAAFPLPSNRTKLKLGGALSAGELGSAIRQARDYCRKKSIPFAVATNGGSWIVFPSVRTDQVAFDDSEAFIFRDFNDIQDRFVEFWEILSRQRVLEGNLESALLGNNSRGLPERSLRQTLQQPGYRLGRNAVFEHIESAVNEALSDEAILESTEALQICYVKTSERLKYDSRLQVHLRDPMPPVGHPTVRVKTRKNQGRMDEAIAASRSKSPLKFVVLLGPVGAGKTTFLHYTRKVSAADSIEGKIVWAMIDFKRATKLDNPRSFILKELLTFIDNDEEFSLGDWEKMISPAYREEVQALRRGPLFLLAKNDSAAFELKVAEIIGRDRENVEPYVQKILTHASSKWSSFLIIDNVDQLEDLDLQAAIFVEAQALSRKIGFHVIMSMRESTYLRHKDEPVFDAFQFESFYIDPPSVLPVLSHRFGYAKKVLSGKSAVLRTEKGASVPVPDLSKFFDLVAHSVLDGESGHMIECLSGGNVRGGLRLVREFLASGHTNADKALAIYLLDGDYRFPRHEIFKGAILGPLKYYKDAASLVPNLLDAKVASHSLQHLRLRIIEFIVMLAQEGVSDGVKLQEIADTLARIGVSEKVLIPVVEDLVTRGMLQTGDGLSVRADSMLFATRLAAFALKSLCQGFSYVEMCLLDTVIYDQDAWVGLKNVTEEIEASRSVVDRIKGRIRRLEIFMNYMRLAEELWIVECRRRDVPFAWERSIVGNVLIPALKVSAQAVLDSTLRAYSGRRGAGGNDFAEESGESRCGIVVSRWSDRDYVFIRTPDGVDWFAHRNDFVSAEDWGVCAVNDEFEFIGADNGKNKAQRVRARG